MKERKEITYNRNLKVFEDFTAMTNASASFWAAYFLILVVCLLLYFILLTINYVVKLNMFLLNTFNLTKELLRP
jgi:hypothetical protein